VFWQQLADILINHPLILDDYLWLMMLNEHFLDYQQTVVQQVEEQLAYSRTRNLLSPASLPVASGQ
jgi:hypothetical protein